MDYWKNLLSNEVINNIFSYLYEEVVINLNFKRYVELQIVSKRFFVHTRRVFERDLMISQAAILNTIPEAILRYPKGMLNPWVKMDLHFILGHNAFQFWNWKNLRRESESKSRVIQLIYRLLNEFIQRYQRQQLKDVEKCDKFQLLLNDPSVGSSWSSIFSRCTYRSSDMVIASEIWVVDGVLTLSEQTKCVDDCVWELALKYKGAMMVLFQARKGISCALIRGTNVDRMDNIT
jgi:hypothetical protein